MWAATELIVGGADFWTVPATGRSALYIATERGMCDMVELMSEQRHQTHQPLDLNMAVATSGMTTMIHVACAFQQPAMVRFLIDKGVDVNVLNEYENTPLVTALLYANEDAAVALILAGADVTSSTHLDSLPM